MREGEDEERAAAAGARPADADEARVVRAVCARGAHDAAETTDAHGVRDAQDAGGSRGALAAAGARAADGKRLAEDADVSSFDPVAYINTPRWQASRLGLERIRALLDRLGRPQDDLRFVHVAGTNGKGSVCSYLAAILQAAGYRTGLFTSPFILRFEERIRVDGVDISHDDLMRATLLVREQAEALAADTGDHPTEFELMCAVALVHFRAAGCDLVVLEVGLGGRLDSTNVIDAPEACIITRIGLDHTALLGDTLAAVAGEKCGIVKPGVPVASWPQAPETLAVVRATCAAQGCKLVMPNFEKLHVMPLKLYPASAEGESVATGFAERLPPDDPAAPVTPASPASPVAPATLEVPVSPAPPESPAPSAAPATTPVTLEASAPSAGPLAAVAADPGSAFAAGSGVSGIAVDVSAASGVIGAGAALSRLGFSSSQLQNVSRETFVCAHSASCGAKELDLEGSAPASASAVASVSAVASAPSAAAAPGSAAAASASAAAAPASAAALFAFAPAPPRAFAPAPGSAAVSALPPASEPVSALDPVLALTPVLAFSSVPSCAAQRLRTPTHAVSVLQNVSRETFVREFFYRDAAYQTVLLGSYQPANAALAIEAVGLLRERGWHISDEAVHAGIAAARWPGRFEVVAVRPLTVIDGGHNPQGAQALADSLADLLEAVSPDSFRLPDPSDLPKSDVPSSSGGPSRPDAPSSPEGPSRPDACAGSEILSDFSSSVPLLPTASSAFFEDEQKGNRKVVIVMGVLADKDYPAMVEAIAPLADAFVCYAPDNPRALAAADLAATVSAALARLSCSEPSVAEGEPALSEAAEGAPGCPSARLMPDCPAASPAPARVETVSGVVAASPAPARVETAPDAAAALRRGRDLAGSEGIAVAFGSLYAVADLKRAL